MCGNRPAGERWKGSDMIKKMAMAVGLAGGLVLGLAAPAWADLASGQAAYLSGDYGAAWRELKPLADQGVAEAQYQIGVMYDHGQSVKRSYRTAAQWYERAAEQGHPGAQFNLGFMFYNGSGEGDDPVAQNYADSAAWLTRAAASGIGEAQYMLSNMYMRGNGVARDFDRAIRLATGAARKGVSGARYNVGLLLGNSDNRDDVIEAYKWFSLLALDQYPGAAANRDRVARRLRPEDISEGKRRADALR